MAAQDARDFEAGDAWKHQIEDDPVGFEALRLVDARFAVHRIDHEKPVGRQLGGEEIAQVGRVLNDEDQWTAGPDVVREAIGRGD